MFQLRVGLISWNSQSQKCVVVSTREAECSATCHATQEALWLRKLFFHVDLPQKLPTRILGDNQTTIRLVKIPKLHNWAKHIDTQYHFIREKYQLQEIDIDYCLHKIRLLIR